MTTQRQGDAERERDGKEKRQRHIVKLRENTKLEKQTAQMCTRRRRTKTRDSVNGRREMAGAQRATELKVECQQNNWYDVPIQCGWTTMFQCTLYSIVVLPMLWQIPRLLPLPLSLAHSQTRSLANSLARAHHRIMFTERFHNYSRLLVRLLSNGSHRVCICEAAWIRHESLNIDLKEAEIGGSEKKIGNLELLI